jgi:hypothetical protein
MQTNRTERWGGGLNEGQPDWSVVVSQLIDRTSTILFRMVDILKFSSLNMNQYEWGLIKGSPTLSVTDPGCFFPDPDPDPIIFSSRISYPTGTSK